MNPTDGWREIRKRHRRWSYFSMLFLPSLATLFYSGVRQFYWQMSGISWFLVFFTYALHGILYGVFTTQLVIWWHWQPRQSARWRSGLTLLAVYLIGLYLTSIWQMLSGSIGLVPASSICLGYGLAGIASHWFIVVAIGSVNAVHIVDRADENDQSFEAAFEIEREDAVDVKALEERISTGSQRSPFSIATLMLATLVSALIFVLLRWTREVYGASGFAGGYPESDVGQITGLLGAAIANSFCMFAAVYWCRQRSIWMPLVLILAGLVLSVAGKFVGLMSGSTWAAPMDFGMMFALVLDAAGMWLLHVWLLKKWSQAGYRFA